MDGNPRTVGERGQVTLPKDLRERFGIDGGDTVIIRAESGKLVIEPPVTREEMAEGYRERAARARDLADEFEGASREANETLGDPPRW